MIWLLNLSTALEREMPPLARLLRTSMRSARTLQEIADAARASDVSADLILTAVGDGTQPGLRQMRNAWRACTPATSIPPAWWCEYAAWAIDRGTNGERTPNAMQVRNYLVGVRDAGTGLKTALEAAHVDLYAAPIPDGEGGAERPMLTPAQTAGIVAAIDALVVSVRGG